LRLRLLEAARALSFLCKGPGRSLMVRFISATGWHQNGAASKTGNPAPPHPARLWSRAAICDISKAPLTVF
jgi:hypothetical protein